MAIEYPARCPFFAHKFVRLLTKSCAAQDIGLNAFALLCVIAHQEDSARYTGPVRFWNEQLMNVLGFKSPKQLNECRAKAIEFGWLQYERSGNREVGRYAVLIPESFEGLDDSQIEPNHSVNHSAIHSESGTNKERIPERLGDESRNELVTESGKPSIPIPSPIPSYSPGEEIQIPEKLNKPEVMRVAGLWFRHLELKDKPEKIPPRNSPQEQAWWSQIAKLGAEKFLTMAEKAMAEGWVTLRDVPEVATKAKPEQSSDWIKALNAARSHPQDYEKRRQILGPDLFEALKRTGTSRVANGNEFELKTLSASFEQHLKDIQSGTPISN
jgi:hypothetical protein